MQTSLLKRRAALALAGSAALAGTARAQAPYPSRAVTLVVPFPPGGTSDSVARLVASQMAERMGQAWVVDNRPGAGATLGAELVARAAPDGYTLLNATTAILAVSPHLMRINYDPFKSFTPLTLFAESNAVVACHPSLPVKSVKELVDYGLANPGKLFFGSAGNGTLTHLYGEMFKQRTGVDLQHVPYRGSSLALNDTVAGRVQLIFDTVAVPAAQAGQLRGLASLGTDRNPLLPNVPTLEETGFGDKGGLSWFSVLAPAGLPEPLAKKLIGELEAVVATPKIQQAMERIGVVPRSVSGSDFAAQIRRDNSMFAEVLQKADVKVE